jgi:hypothetical protein
MQITTVGIDLAKKRVSGSRRQRTRQNSLEEANPA